MIYLIVAVSKNGVIGNKGKIPWRIKEEMRFFKNTTMNNAILMGRTTWDSLPKKPLINRRNIVLTNNPIEGVECVNNFNIFEEFREKDKNLFVIGGEMVYTQSISEVDYAIISVVKQECSGDRFFPIPAWEVVKTENYSYFDVLHLKNPKRKKNGNPS